MKCIYVRHGLTSYSRKNLFAGRKNISVVDIDEQLINEAINLVDMLKPKILVHSPLLRAVQTSQCFLDKFSFDDVVNEPLLLERDFGDYEGKEKTADNRKAMESDASVESLVDFELRVANFIDKYRGKKILIVGHSAFYRSLVKRCTSAKKSKLKCCEPTYIEVIEDI
ncbi:histidine phosphatase family protein [Vibrio sp. TRT 29B02]|uniref:histidine phosphatase family protein n=1 Tax=Vibrio sp. TRT 29B02 TaxID=3418508 RepID=UPI003CF15031